MLKRGEEQQNESARRERGGRIHKRGKIAHKPGVIFNSRILSQCRGPTRVARVFSSVGRGWKGKTKRMTKTDVSEWKREREREREIEGRGKCRRNERKRGEREREASFPLAACIIQKLAGLYTSVLLHVETNWDADCCWMAPSLCNVETPPPPLCTLLARVALSSEGDFPLIEILKYRWREDKV